MTRGKWMFLLVLLFGALLLVGCGSNTDAKDEPKTEQQDQNQGKEEPKAEEPKAEEPKAEEPKAEAPKTETPKTETPKTEAPKAETPKTEAPKTEAPKTDTPKAPKLSVPHESRDNCAMCHSGGNMLDPKPPHAIEATTVCTNCHTVNFSK